jgi:O-antigen ligase
MVVYVLIKQMVLEKKRYTFKSIFLLMGLVVLIVYFAGYLNDNMLEGMLMDHFDESSSTGGSGRLNLYSKYINMIWNGSFSSFLFGRGWEGSINSSNLGMTCHNDFLEAFVDFGIIGFILYIAFHVALFTKCRRMINQKSQYAPVMGASVAMFFINSMVSHILIYPWFLMIFALFWGFVISRQRRVD